MKMKSLVLVALSSLFAMSSFAADMNCNGTEPFWHISVQGKTLTYTTPSDVPTMKLKIVSIRDAAGMTPGFATVMKTKYATLTTVMGECSDGMSDVVYSHHAVFDIGGTVLAGCCNMAK